MMNICFWMRRTAALAVASLLVGCSLLKVTVSSGDPLPREQTAARMLTRGFYYDLSGEVARAADSIGAASADAGVRLAAVQWKIRASRAAVTAAMQGNPDVAMADMWILCRRMNASFAARPDSLLFGAQSPVARAAAARLERRAARLARQALPGGRYELMEEFVAGYVAAHPAAPVDGNDNTLLAWIEFLRERGVEPDYSTGSIAEVLSDINDRVSGQTQQIANTVGWTKEMIDIRLGQDSTRSQLGARLDSLERHFGRVVVVAEHLPEVSERLLAEINEQAAQLMETMNASVDNAFFGLERQRRELQQYVSDEREALIGQLHEAGGDLLRTALDALPALVGRIVFWLVVAFLVIVGGPFALGFWLGGVRQRARDRADGGRRS
ncbi:hypothetical protein [uncultured Alistipes sp.]|uniref:hypothetical protein n=1 Tax=uncultured Alistipes sp. TaxID=538949 RepID=UPI00343ACDE8